MPTPRPLESALDALVAFRATWRVATSVRTVRTAPEPWLEDSGLLCRVERANPLIPDARFVREYFRPTMAIAQMPIVGCAQARSRPEGRVYRVHTRAERSDEP